METPDLHTKPERHARALSASLVPFTYRDDTTFEAFLAHRVLHHHYRVSGYVFLAGDAVEGCHGVEGFMAMCLVAEYLATGLRCVRIDWEVWNLQGPKASTGRRTIYTLQGRYNGMRQQGHAISEHWPRGHRSQRTSGSRGQAIVGPGCDAQSTESDLDWT